MFKVHILDSRKIIKYAKIIGVCILIMIIFSIVSGGKKEKGVITVPAHSFIEASVVGTRYMNESDDFQLDTNISLVNNILGMELDIESGIVANANIDDLGEATDESTDTSGTPNTGSDSIATYTDIENMGPANTEVQGDRNVKANYTNTYGNVQVNNRTEYPLTEEMLKPNPEIPNKKNVFIFHTHTSESYTPTEQMQYTMTGNYRTTDLNYTVSRVGDELTNELKKRGFTVSHSKTSHDYPAYSGSYDRSFTTIQNELKNKNTSIVIDLHRDALGDGKSYGPTVEINGERVAQLMFVIGTDGAGLKHDNWVQNMKFAVKVQQKANELYPGLFRPISLSTSRYNQQLTQNATIVEVGATANTLEESMGSMKYLAEVLKLVTQD
jgi:stage II sporulation protein P